MKTIFTYLCFFLFTSFVFEISAQVWESKAPGTLPDNYLVYSISIVNEQVIWALANDITVDNPPIPSSHIPILLESTDGGETWVVKDIEEAMGRISRDIHTFDENTAFITTQNLGPPGGRGIFRTTDGGDSWTEVLNHDAGGFMLHFFDDQDGVGINEQHIARTTNGGMTWTTGTILGFQSDEGTITSSIVNGMGVFGDILWFGTTKGRVFRSLDMGNSWEAFPAGLGNTACISSIAFVDDKNGIALYYFPSSEPNSHLAKTSDGGVTWEPVNYDYQFTEVTAIPCSRVFMGVSWRDSITTISTDLGETWELLDNQSIAGVATFKSTNLGWMAGGAGIGANGALHKWVGNPLYGRTYVNQNANGNNDGSSWSDAYTDLQDAFANAKEGDEIWVAEGTYLPDAPGGASTATFLMDKNLKVYGGFSGSECNLSERNFEMYPTILSGDLNGNDVDDDFDNFKSDNVMTLVTVHSTITNATVIDGFTIRNGYADGSGDNAQTKGGAVFSEGAPVIRNCLFTQNYASADGGAAQVQSQTAQGITFEHCDFKNNRTEFNGDSNGGAITASGVHGEGVTILQCNFDNNMADWSGGVWLWNSNGFLDGVTFTNNVSPRHAGAIGFNSHIPNSTLSVLNCTFEGNSAVFGGGIYALVNGDDAVIEIINTTFKENSTAPVLPPWVDSGGGGFCCFISEAVENTNITLDQCTFESNTTAHVAGGAGIINQGNFTTATVTNCSFVGNESIYHASGLDLFIVENANHATMMVDSCTFSQNHNEMWVGGGLRASLLGFNNNLTLSNSDFINNSTGLSGAGAAIYGFDSSSTGSVNVFNNTFDSNVSYNDAGLSIGSGTDAGYFEYSISQCTFTNNHTTNDGGGLALYNERPAKYLVENCIIDGNSSDGPYGGLSIFNTSPGMKAMIKNCKILNNDL